jgi:hypothetical protein
MKAIHKLILAKINILLFLMFAVSSSLSAQTVLLKRETVRDTVERKFGKNRKIYVGLFFGYGFVAGKETPGLPIQYGNSSELVVGIWGKRKLNSHFSIVPELAFRTQWFRIAQNNTKSVPDSFHYELERYTFPTFNANAYIRYNFKAHKGNHFGTYLDIGAGINLPVWERHRRVIDDKNTKNEVVVIRKNLQYIEPIQVTANVRLGYKRWSVYGTYRLTDIFKQDKGKEIFNQTIDLPPVMVGIMMML